MGTTAILLSSAWSAQFRTATVRERLSLAETLPHGRGSNSGPALA